MSVRRSVLALVLFVPLALLGGFILLVQSPWGAQWLGARVGSQIHREVQIEGIRVKFEWPPALTFQRLRIGNPPWAKTPSLLDARGLYARVSPAPLFEKRIVIPYLAARSANAGLELDGARATWRFDEEQREPSRIELAVVYLDQGHVSYLNEKEDTAINAEATGSFGKGGELKVNATGKFRGEPAKGSALFPSLMASFAKPIRFEGKANVGQTNAAAEGDIGPDFKTLDFHLRLAGPTLKDLHQVLGLVLPETPPYRVAGHLRYASGQWIFDPFEGTVGGSDLRGSVVYHKENNRPLFQANLRSKLLDFGDLGPLIGAPPKTGPGRIVSPKQQVEAAQLAVSTQVLPHKPFDTQRWGEMDADVRLEANTVLRPKQLPIDALSTHLILKDSVLRLEPLNFGVAGGRVTSNVALDGQRQPMTGQIDVEVQGLQLGHLFPTVKSMQPSLGNLYGRGKFSGKGNSVGDLLGTSNGQATLAVDSGQVSELLIELLEIDVAKAAMLLGTRKQTELNCAVGSFTVKDGVATPESFVVDTTDTFVKVEGMVDLQHERLDLTTRARSKRPSALVLHAPIVMEGPLKRPSIHPKAGVLVAQAGAAAALAAINPALAITPFLDPGGAQSADCKALLAEAKAKGAVQRPR